MSEVCGVPDSGKWPLGRMAKSVAEDRRFARGRSPEAREDKVRREEESAPALAEAAAEQALLDEEVRLAAVAEGERVAEEQRVAAEAKAASIAAQEKAAAEAEGTTPPDQAPSDENENTEQSDDREKQTISADDVGTVEGLGII